MKEKFLNSFGEDGSPLRPGLYYLYGNPYKVYAITKFTCDEYYSLYAFDPVEKLHMFLKVGTFDELMDILNLLTYPFESLYYECCRE